MPARYSKQQSKTGASIGTIIAIPKPNSWTNSTNPTTESSNWNIANDYPGWLECDGRILSVANYPALYRVIGNRYGGVSGSTFALPDYRSKKLMGTGTVDSNVSSAPSLTPNSAPTGIPPSIVEPGSQGGMFTVTTVRQLPPGSEITPSAPSTADVFFDVSGPVLGVTPTFSGVAYQNYGTGVTEIGGFAEPFIPNGGRYIGFGTIGTTPFGTIQYTRIVTYANLDLTGYSFVRIYSIAGNDNNGGERVNTRGEGLKVVWPNGTFEYILPAAEDVGGIAAFDEAYTAWRELQVEIPIEYRRPGVTIQFRQDVNQSTGVPPDYPEHAVPDNVSAVNQNAFDMIGIQRVGFLGGEIGGEATDTFTLGTYRTSGIGQTSVEAAANFSGNISFSAGNSATGTGTRVIGTPPHTHDHHHIKLDLGGQLWPGSNGNYYVRLNNRVAQDIFKVIGGWNESFGSVITYDRSGDSLLSHSHMITWGPLTDVHTIGTGTRNDNTSGILTNRVESGGSSSNEIRNTSSNLGNIISKTLDVQNDLGASLNPGTLTLSETSRSQFDNSLSIRLQAAEEIPLMSAYFRTKYIIKAY